MRVILTFYFFLGLSWCCRTFEPWHSIWQTLFLCLSVILWNDLPYLFREFWTASSRVMWYHVLRVAPQGAFIIYLVLHPLDTSPVGILHPTDKSFPWCHGAYSLLGNLHMLCPLNQFLEVAWCHLPSLELSKKRDSFQAGQRCPPLSRKLFIYLFFEDTKSLHPDPQGYIYLVCLVLILGLAKRENILLCWIKHFTASCPGSQDSLSYWPAASAYGFNCISPYSCSVVSEPNSVLTWIQC